MRKKRMRKERMRNERERKKKRRKRKFEPLIQIEANHFEKISNLITSLKAGDLQGLFHENSVKHLWYYTSLEMKQMGWEGERK